MGKYFSKERKNKYNIFLITALKILTLYKHTSIITHIYVIKSGRENRLNDSTATCILQGANTDKAKSALNDDFL